jgi:large exoprotein involved in heme utilization and adhesion
VTSLGTVAVTGGSTLNVSDPVNLGSGGSVFIRSGTLIIDATEINADNYGSGTGGLLLLRGDNQLALSNEAFVHALVLGTGNGASIVISTAPSGVITTDAATVLTGSIGPGNAGTLTVEGGQLILANGAGLTSLAKGSGNGGSISIAAGSVVLDGDSTSITSTTAAAGLSAPSGSPIPAGAGGSIKIAAGTLTIQNGASVTAASLGDGLGGGISITSTGDSTIDGTLTRGSTSLAAIQGIPLSTTGILSGSRGSGDAGPVTLSSTNLRIANNGGIASLSTGLGNAGGISVDVTGTLAIDGTSAISQTGIASIASRNGNAGPIAVSAGDASILNNGVIQSSTLGFGNAGDVLVKVSGALLIDGTSANPAFLADPMMLPFFLTGISSLSLLSTSGSAGNAAVGAGTLTIRNNGIIASLSNGLGNAGEVSVEARGGLTVDGTSATSQTGIANLASGHGSAGPVAVSAGNVSILNNGVIQSNTAGPGNAGDVRIDATGALLIDGTFANPTLLADLTMLPFFLTGVSSLSLGNKSETAGNVMSGNAGNVTIDAGTLMLRNNGIIASGSTPGSPANGGNISVNVGGLLSIDGLEAKQIPLVIDLGVPLYWTGIGSGSTGSGSGGNVMVSAAAVDLLNGGTIGSGSLGSGNGGEVTVNVTGTLKIDGTEVSSNPFIVTRISSGSDSFGNGGTITVNAGSLAIRNAGTILSGAFGSGKGGDVTVNVTGSLLIDGSMPGPDPTFNPTGISSRSNPGSTGDAGAVSVRAGTLSIVKSALIGSDTFGSGKGGDVSVVVASDLALSGVGPNGASGIAASAQAQISASSTGSGDAGLVTVSAGRLLLSNGAAISTEATTANGGNITLKVGDFLFLTNSKISASVNRETGNGGNITIDPEVVILDHSEITAQAAAGQGGNIRINTGLYIVSADSVVSASSALGISGTIEIIGPRVDLNGALVVLSSELRSAAQVLRNSCAAQSGLPQSSLVEAGRGGLPQDPDATLPALYIAGRDMSPTSPTVPGPLPAITAQQTTARLTVRCG